MLVFWKPRAVLLATPKTGTTSIMAALVSLADISIAQPAKLKHTSVRRYHQFLRPYLESASEGPFSTVALIREPRDWLGSWYRYRQRETIDITEKSTKDVSFDEFVQAYCSDPRPDFAKVGSQSRFLAPHHTGAWVDRLFRYEDIGDLVQYLEERLDCEILLPRLNVSPMGSLELSAKTEALLHSFAAKDFALYRTLQPAGV